MVDRRRFVASSLLLACPGLPAWAQSSSFPARPIRIVVALPPGGSNDVLARVIAERLQAKFGQAVIVENKPGAAGNIATEYVARQPPDGYTLLLTPNAHVVNPYFFAKLPYDPIKDFEPVSMVGSVAFVLTVNGSTPVHSMQEFLAFARANNGKTTYGSAGIGQPHHLAVELLKSMTGIDFVHVPYKGGAAIVVALLAGDIHFTIGAINSLLPHIRTGKLRAIAMAGAQRNPLLPDVPTIAEALPGYVVTSWAGILAPARTPRTIVDLLSAEINRAVQDPEVVKNKLNPIGIDAIGTSPDQFMDMMKADLALYAKITREAKIKPE